MEGSLGNQETERRPPFEADPPSEGEISEGESTDIQANMAANDSAHARGPGKRRSEREEQREALRGYKIPRIEPTEVEVVGFEELVPEDPGVEHESAGEGANAISGSKKAGALQDPTFFDPLVDLEDTDWLEPGQWEFLRKYFMEPGFQKKLLGLLEEECPVPEDIVSSMQRPIDNEIAELIPKSVWEWAKDTDTNLLQIAARLGVSLGPILQLWSEMRAARTNNPAMGEWCRLLEMTLAGLGQVNAAVLFYRRKNVLTWFFAGSEESPGAGSAE